MSMVRRLYSVLLVLLLPLALLRLLWRSLRAPEYRRRWRERFGRAPQPPAPGAIWVHAVSLGEVQAATPLIKRLRRLYPERPILVTTTTPTGSQRVLQVFRQEVLHCYLPYDIPWFVSRFLDRIQPELVIIMETEIWPNLLAVCAQRQIPLLLANARLSARSAAGYRRVKWLIRPALQNISLIAAQEATDAERFLALGAHKEVVKITGNIKFDVRIPASVQEHGHVFRRLWGVDRPVWVAASTHEGEEELMLKAQARIRAELPAALLVLVPRHPERFAKVAAMIRRQEMPLVMRSESKPCTQETAVFLGDSMGELPILLSAADAAFIGGSLVTHGGHNALEAAALGLPVVFGPYMFNFTEISRLLLERQAAVQISGWRELATLMIRWLQEANERVAIGENGRLAVASNRGALDRLLCLVTQRLPPGKTKSLGGPALEVAPPAA